MTAPAPRPDRALLTPAEVADLLGVIEVWVRRKAAAHLLPCTRLGRQIRFSTAQLDEIVAAAAQPAAVLPLHGLTRRSRRAG
jgi:excisionase family DNA binding protein